MNFNNKLTVYILFIVNIVLLAYLVVNECYLKKSTKTNINELDKEITINNLSRSLSSTFVFQNRKLEATTPFIDSINKHVSTGKLVLRFSEYSCSSCVDDALQELKKLKSEVRDSDIVIIGSFSKNRDFLILKNKIKSGYIFINELKGFRIDKDLNDIKSPHFFILDPKGRIQYFYLYQENNHALNRSYFEGVKYNLEAT